MAGKPTYEELEQRVKDLEKEALKQMGPEGELWINEGEEWRSDELSYKAFSMSTIPTAITTLSDGSVLKVNEAFEHLTGYREDEIKGRSLVDLSVWNDPEDRTRVVNDLLEKGAVRNRAIRVRNRSGEIRVCLFSAEIIEFGGKQCMLSMAIDETGRQRAEEALRESETRYREIESSIPGVVYQFVLKKDGSYSSPYMSGTASSILDISAAEVMADAHSLFEMIVEEDMDAVNRSIAESARTMNRWLQEFRIRDKAGAIRWIRATSIPHLLPNGEIIWNGVLLDISDRIRAEEALQKAHNDLEKRIEERTAELAKANKDLQAKIIEHKQAEESLRESEELYRQSVENSPNPIFSIDKEGIVQAWNRSCEQIFQYSSEEIIGQAYHKLLMNPEDLPAVEAMLARVWQGESFSDIEMGYRCKDGTLKFTISRLYPLHLYRKDVQGCVFANTNITERRQTENLMRTQRDLGVSLGAAPGLDEGLRLCVEAACQVSGMDCGSVYLIDRTSGALDLIFHKGLPPGFVKSVSHYDADSANMHLVMAGKPIYTKHQRLGVPLDETELGEELRAIAVLPVHHEDRVIGCLNVASHTLEEVPVFARVALEAITAQIGSAIARLEAEKALQESEEQFSLFMDYLPAIVFIKDKNGKTLYVNKYMNDVLGAKDWIGKSTLELFPKDVAELMIADDKKTMSKGYQEVVEKVPNKNNKINTYQTFKFRINRHGMLPLLGGIALDITKRLETEEALRKSEAKLSRSKKMESMGLLAGGVAHDLNNVLSGIVSYPDLLLMDLPEDSKLRKPIETMQESGQRAAAIVQDLLTVARGIATTKEPLNLNDIVSHYLNSPEFKNLEQFHPTATVTTTLDTDLLNTSASHVHIRKVVMNLVSNASEAIEGGGNVTISTMNRYVDRPLRGYDDVTIGEYAVLAVSDDGSGISSDDLERIFEPFYTKKVMGRSGTGLGLAVVWNVMQDHKGYIDVISDENGTTFELYFPITRDEISDKALSIPIKDYKGDGETILIVDDVESQREISCKMLDTLGYKTKAVSSGEEAVEYLKKHTVNLLLLDMIMDPGINGHETYERIITIHPNQKAIIVSGFAETDEVKKTQKLGAGKYIKKPVTLEKIGLAIKEELGK